MISPQPEALSLKNSPVGHVISDVVEKQTYTDGSVYYRTKYARDTAKKQYGFVGTALLEVVPETPPPIVTEPSPTTKDPVTGEPLPDTGKPITEKDDYQAFIESISGGLVSLLKLFVEFLKKIFKTKE